MEDRKEDKKNEKADNREPRRVQVPNDVPKLLVTP